MTRMIDADAVYKILESCEIRKATIGNPLTDWEYGYTCGIERAESEIECAPTVNAVPVIRCQECKHFKNHTGKFREQRFRKDGICKYHNYEQVMLDGFCSNAERGNE